MNHIIEIDSCPLKIVAADFLSNAYEYSNLL
jgi:hypothetical protein